MITFSEFIYNNPSLPKFKDPKSAYNYILNKKEGRQEELEVYIVRDPEYAYKYAKNILNGRWKQAEPYIRDSIFADLYARDVIKGPWPEIEPETDSIDNYGFRNVGQAHMLPIKL